MPDPAPNPKAGPTNPQLQSPSPERIPHPRKPAPRAGEAACDRCGADMFRMHAVWRCPRCGFKTDCCGW